MSTIRQGSAKAAATLLITPLDGNPFSPGGSGEDLRNLQTEAELVSSDAVVELAAEKAGTSMAPYEMAARVAISVPPNTQIIKIEYSARAEDSAVRGAQALAEAFLEYREARAEDLVNDRTTRVQHQIDQRSEELEDLIVAIQAAPDPSPDRELLGEEITSVTAQLGQLRTTMTELSVGTIDPGQIVTPATVSERGWLDSQILFPILGLVLGTVFALIVLLPRSQRNTGIDDGNEIETLGFPLLGEVQLDDVRPRTKLTPSGNRVLSAAFNDLRVSLLTRIHTRPVTILFSSLNSDGLPPLTGWDLAESVALSHKTILVDASGKFPASAAPAKVGLEEVLLGEASIDEATVELNERMTVLAATPRNNSVSLFLSPELPEILAELKRRADVVMIISESLQSPGARSLAMAVDVLVLEAGQGVTSKRDLVSFSEDDLGPAEFGGVVFVAGPRRRRPLISDGTYALP